MVWGWMDCSEIGQNGEVVEWKCDCVLNSTEQDCEYNEDPCAPSSQFPTYDSLLHAMFTEEELLERVGMPILEPELIEALNNDVENKCSYIPCF